MGSGYRQDQDKTEESPHPSLPSPSPPVTTISKFSNEDCTEKRVLTPNFSPSPFVSSRKGLSLNGLTPYYLHDSLLQGHIPASRGPLHPRPAPLVVQVLVSQYVVDWPWCLAHHRRFIVSVTIPSPPPPSLPTSPSPSSILPGRFVARFGFGSRQDQRDHPPIPPLPLLTTLSHFFVSPNL